jgi:hypothetical protein
MINHSDSNEIKQRKRNHSVEPLLNTLIKFNRNDKEQQTTIVEDQKKVSSFSLENVCWVVAAILTVYSSDILRVVLYSKNIHRQIMIVSFLMIGGNILIAVFLIFYATYVKKIDSSKWNEKYPTLIPIATGLFFAGSIL